MFSHRFPQVFPCFPHRFPPCGFTQTRPKWPRPKCLPSRWDVGSWSCSTRDTLRRERNDGRLGYDIEIIPILLLGVYRFYKPLYIKYIYICIGDDEYSIYFWVYHIVTLAYEFRRLFLVETTRRSCCKHWHLDVAPVPIYTPCHNGRGFLLSLNLCAPSTLSVWIGLTYSLD